MWISRKKADRERYYADLMAENERLHGERNDCLHERSVLKVERDAARERVGVLLGALGDVINLPMHVHDIADGTGDAPPSKMLVIPIHADARAPTALPDEYDGRLAAWVASVCLRQGARLGAAGLTPTRWHLLNDNQLGIAYTELAAIPDAWPEVHHG